MENELKIWLERADEALAREDYAAFEEAKAVVAEIRAEMGR